MIKLALVLPFCGYRYNTDIYSDLNDVTAPPYDIIPKEEQQALFDKNEHNIIRIDYGPEYSTDTDADNKYTRAGKDLKKWIADNVLVKEDKPAFYIYEQIFSLGSSNSSNSLKGILSKVQLQEFSENVILPHEFTISKAKTDRLNLMRQTAANTSPIYSLYLDEDEKIASVIDKNSDCTPDLTFVTDEGVRQNIWIVTDESVCNEITNLFENKKLFIADGHHRYETALNYRNERHEADGTEVNSCEYDYIMMMLVSMSNSGLFVFPTHRLVRDSHRYDETLLVGMLTENFSVSKIYFTEGDYADIITDRLSNSLDEKLFGLYTGGNYYYLLELKSLATIDSAIDGMSDAYKHLDVTVLHKLILERFLGIDEENMKKQSNLSYMRDAAEAVQAVKDGEYQCAFIINPTKVSEIKNVASANEKMPQKSTYFWPKLVTGIVINKFD